VARLLATNIRAEGDTLQPDLTKGNGMGAEQVKLERTESRPGPPKVFMATVPCS
jgi:hypothetical protein